MHEVEVTGRRERERERGVERGAWGSIYVGIEGGSKVSSGSLFIYVFKNKSENLKCGKRKKQVAQMVSY